MSEQEDNPTQSDKVRLSEQALRAYKRVVDDVALAADEPGLQELLDLHAVVPNTHSPGRYVALDPQQAAHALLWEGFNEVTSIMGRLSGIPTIAELLQVEHERSKWRSGIGSEFLEGKSLVNARIDKVMASATEELLTSQPRRRTESLIKVAGPRDAALLDRGCSMRTLYPYSARIGTHEPKWMKRMTKKGAAVRTLSIPFPRMVVIDRRHAFIEDLIVEGSSEHAAWYVTDRAVVEWITMVYELYWDRADPWSEPVNHEEQITNAIQRSILREMVGGRDQKRIAFRLNISEKTIHNQLADLRSRLDLSTTIQLVYWWATSPENDSSKELKLGEPLPTFP